MKRLSEIYAERTNDLPEMSPFEIFTRTLNTDSGATAIKNANIPVKLYRVHITPVGLDDEIHLEFKRGGITIGIDPGPVNDSEATYEVKTYSRNVYRFSEQSSPCRIIAPRRKSPGSVLADIHKHITTIFPNPETSELLVNCTDTPSYFGTFCYDKSPVSFDELKVRQAGPPAAWDVMTKAIRAKRVVDFVRYRGIPLPTNPLDLIVIRTGRKFDLAYFNTLLARHIQIHDVNTTQANHFLVEWTKDRSEASELIGKMDITINGHFNMDRITNGLKRETNADLEQNGVLRELNAKGEVSRFEDVRNGYHMIHEHTGRLATIYQKEEKEVCLHVWDRSPRMNFESNLRGLLGEASSLANKKKREKEAIERMLKKKERELEELQIVVDKLKREVDTCQSQIDKCNKFREANRSDD